MPEKDPLNYSIITYSWVLLLSAWGGLVNFLNKRQAGAVKPFNLTEFIGDLMTSSFSGIITFYLCEASNLDKLASAVLIGISGHMGSRAIFHIEKLIEKKFEKII